MAATLSEILEKLEFSEFEDQLTGLGVSEAKDVLELEQDDLKGIGLSVVQIRKLQNAIKKPATNGNGGFKKAAAEEAPAAPQCPKCSDELTKVIAENNLYECDGCQKKIQKGQPVFGCRDCNYDMCKVCAAGGTSKTTVKRNGGGAAPCKWCRMGECWTHNQWTPLEQAVVKKVKKGPRKAFKRTFLEIAEGEFDADVSAMARSELDLVIDGGPSGTDNYHPPISSFEEMGDIPAYCIEALNKMGITTPMPIQAQAIPLVLSGMDLVGVAKTGSGKTLAYLLPAVVHIEAQEPIEDYDLTPIAIVLAPTRELAVQIHEEAEKLLSTSEGAEGSNHPNGLKACCIYGGERKQGQLRNACGAHIIAATPGRLHEHVMKDEISMDRVTFFILDEGDRMLEEGFEAQVKVIANAIRDDRHMLFFSATWPMGVHRLAKAMCKGSKPPVRLRVGQNKDGSAKTRDDITQEVVVFDDRDWDARDKQKKEHVFRHVREALELGDTKVLVFMSRKDLCEEMSYVFNGEGFESEAMHGGKSQDARLSVLERFKNASTRLLVTTDVMGRGLDIPTITHVVVYDMGDIDDYVHRIGRTARGPQGNGHALTLFEYDPRWPHLAEGLIKVLERSNQDIPDELRNIAEEVRDGTREMKKVRGRYGGMSGDQGGWDEIHKKTYGVSADDETSLLSKW